MNGLGPQFLADAAAQRQIAMMHFSTDYVFPGNATDPYRENDPVAPINAYGESKLHGERAVLASGAHALILRTQRLFGRGGSHSRGRCWRASPGLPTRVVNDQIGHPKYTRDLATATWRLIEQRASGIVHVTNGGAATTWYAVAREVFARVGSTTLLSLCTTDQNPTPARRPAYSVLSTDRLASLLSGPLPDWRDALVRSLDEITGEPPAADALPGIQ